VVSINRTNCDWLNEKTIDVQLTCSISFRLSKSALLSLISLEEIHVLIWSRCLCSFLISFFRSASYFSFWFALVDVSIFSSVSSKVSTPSATFFKTLSISAKYNERKDGSSHGEGEMEEIPSVNPAILSKKKKRVVSDFRRVTHSLSNIR